MAILVVSTGNIRTGRPRPLHRSDTAGHAGHVSTLVTHMAGS